MNIIGNLDDEVGDLLEVEAGEFALTISLLSMGTRHLVPELLAKIAPDDFADPSLGAIWAAARTLNQAGTTISRRTLLTIEDTPPIRHRLKQASGEYASEHTINQAAAEVTEMAKRRRLYDALKRALYHAPDAGSYSEALHFASEQLASLSEATVSDDTVSFADALTRWQEWVEAPKEQARTIPTPWPSVNDVLAGGLHPGRTYVVGGRPGEGKAAALDTPIPTPDGWTTMGEIKPGDHVYDEHGQPILVTWESQVWTDRTCYRVTFDDGSSVVVDGEHEWLTDTRQSRKVLNNPTTDRVSPFGRDQRWKSAKAEVRTTREIADTLRVGKENRLNHSINTVSEPLKGSDVTSPIDPYVLGVWLGDGYSRAAQFTSADIEIVDEVRRRGYRAEPVSGKYHYSMAGDGTVMSALRELELHRNKHIPAHFMRAPEEFRLDLVRGLMDTDGTVDTYGRVELTLCNKTLAMDAVELIRTFGWKVHVKESDATLNGKAVGRRWRIKFSPDQIVFRLPRKANRQAVDRRATTRRWYITDIQEVPSVPTKCIEVDSKSHLYLLGETMVPTHNSIAGVNMAQHAAEQGHPSVIFSVEMGETEVVSRILAAGARAEYGQITKRDIDGRNYEKIGEYIDTYAHIPLTLVDKSDLTVEQIASRCRTLKRTTGLDVIVVDYLQLLRESDSRVQRERQVAMISRSLKILSRELDCAVIVACQLNRNAANAERKPALSELRESGAIEQDADVVILLHHEQEQGQPTGIVEFVVAKNRTGKTDSIPLEWRAYQARVGERGNR